VISPLQPRATLGRSFGNDIHHGRGGFLMRAFFAQYFGVVLILVGLALVLTAVVFRKRWFERGPQKGKAADPAKVKRENPPEDWRRSH
jgi:hypothetical protein